MAHTRIDVASGNAMGAALLEAVDLLAEGKAQLERIKEATAAMVDYGPPSSFARLETEYGCSAGDAEALHNLIVGAAADLDAAGNIYNLLTRVDQG